MTPKTETANPERLGPSAETAVAWHPFFGVGGQTWHCMEGLCEIAVGNVDAMVKSLTILERGSRALQTTGIGLACMTIEEAGSAAKALQTCSNPVNRLGLGALLVRLTILRIGMRMLLASMTAAEVIDDAAFPLVRRADAVVDRLASETAS